jgi:chitin disaccharide deacetylase
MRRLIINADDFGWDHETAEATISLMELGVVTSATIIMGRPATDVALDYASSHRDSGLSFGLHFNIVDGHPSASLAPSSLTDSGGRFRSSNVVRLAALFGSIRADDVAREARAQIEAFLASGVKPSHLDSHGHLHKFPSIARALVPVLDEYQIRRVRRPQNLYFSRSVFDMVDTYCRRTGPRFDSTDYFCAIEPTQPHWLARIAELLPQGTSELAVHPGINEPWRRNETVSLKEAGAAFFKRHDIQLISYLALD